MGAIVFEGTTDLADAKVWLNQVEKCFRVMRYPEDRKLELATFMLQKGAGDWWRLIENRRGDVESLTWTDFRKTFQDKYYPRSFCHAKRNEFLRLVQGNMIVADYEKKFTKLAKYAMIAIADETDRCKRFEEGLQKEIRTLVQSGMTLLS